MGRSHSFWNILSAVLGAVAAVVTALTGLYLALKSDASPSASISGPPPAESTDVTGTVYDRTPWLGVELRQNNQAVRLRSVNGSWNQFEAKISRDAFELIFTRRAEDPHIGIMAWHDDSVFEIFKDEKFLSGGRGIAGAVFAVPILYLDKEGFNHYDTQRLKRIDDDKYSILISTLGSGELQLPLARYSGPLHLVIFHLPEDFEQPVTRNSYELFTLQRD
jgi:hypothetical protein